ncbi:TetR/AcrR family transcriptional regulator [Parasedimentitalea marina]|uniref:TetR/AcrR family transcriptional regulator n=2 Tax=Parasedimentitalea marina TaxID=2483033 RepID=A0A3T0N8N0_9RHOB|nr:TetR/AcrR family transcriptional regulator [Parasedimentitalea marina]
MTDTMTKIAAGLERAFASRGFAEPSVEDLRDAAAVSLRTLYKYTPSRSEMVLAALEHRHRRYLSKIFDDIPDDPKTALDAMFDRVGVWMETETAHGCLFHGAVASEPGSARLRELLERHKAEVATCAVKVTDLVGCEVEILVILEGLTQAWALHRNAALESAKLLGRGLRRLDI